MSYHICPVGVAQAIVCIRRSGRLPRDYQSLPLDKFSVACGRFTSTARTASVGTGGCRHRCPARDMIAARRKSVSHSAFVSLPSAAPYPAQRCSFWRRREPVPPLAALTWLPGASWPGHCFATGHGRTPRSLRSETPGHRNERPGRLHRLRQARLDAGMITGSCLGNCCLEAAGVLLPMTPKDWTGGR